MVGIVSVHKAQVLRDMLIINDSSDGGGNYPGYLSIAQVLCNSHLDSGMNGDDVVLVRHERLVGVTENLALALFARLIQRQVVGAKHHILRRNGNRLTVGWLEQVLGGEHEISRLVLRLLGKGKMNRHLVTVEVRVKRGTAKRVQLDSPALNQYRRERLNTQTVQRRRAVKQHGVVFDHAFQRIPHLVVGALHQLLCLLDVRRNSL